MPFLPKDYDELLDYFSEEERLDYVRLTMQLGNGHITEEFFNAKHQELFEKAAQRKKDVFTLIARNFPPADFELLGSLERKEYLQTVIWYKTKYIDKNQFVRHTNDLLKQVKDRKENAEQNEKLIKEYRNSDDQICMKLYGASHSDYSFLDRYKRKMKKKEDPRQVSTFYDV